MGTPSTAELDRGYSGGHAFPPPGKYPRLSKGCMSSASSVRETRGLGGDDAWRTLVATGRLKLFWHALQRLRASDGFTHARSLAFGLSLVVVQGVVALVACM